MSNKDLEYIRECCKKNAEIAKSDSFTRTRTAQIQAKISAFDKTIPSARQ